MIPARLGWTPVVAAVLLAQPAVAAPRAFHLHAGPLASALNELARESGVDLVFAPGDVPDRQVSAVRSTSTVEAALSRLQRAQ